MINYEATSEMCLCMCDSHICTRSYASACMCAYGRASECSPPAVWQESSIGVILVTVVSGKNSATVSVQSVLGDLSIRLGRQIPV